MTRLNSIDRAAEKLADTRRDSEFDERERAVYAESGTFASTLGILAMLLIALILSAIGHFFAAFAVLIAGMIPELGATWYAMRREVDPQKLRNTWRSRFSAWTVTALSIALFLIWTVHLVMGRSLIPVEVDPSVQPFGNLVITWILLGILLLLSLWMHRRRREIRRAEASPEED